MHKDSILNNHLRASTSSHDTVSDIEGALRSYHRIGALIMGMKTMRTAAFLPVAAALAELHDATAIYPQA